MTNSVDFLVIDIVHNVKLYFIDLFFIQGFEKWVDWISETWDGQFGTLEYDPADLRLSRLTGVKNCRPTLPDVLDTT